MVAAILHVGVDFLLLVVVDRTSACFVFEDEDPEEAIFPPEIPLCIIVSRIINRWR